MSPPVASGDVRRSQAFCILFILLLPLALAGLALINTGLSRSRSAAHSMMATLCVIGVAAATYFVTGFAWQGYPDLPSHTSVFLERNGAGWERDTSFCAECLWMDPAPRSRRFCS